MENKSLIINTPVVYNTTEDERKEFNCDLKQLPAIIVAILGDSDDSPCDLKVLVHGTPHEFLKHSLSVKYPDENGNVPEGNWNWPNKK